MNKKNLFSQPFKRVSKEIIVLFHIMGKYLIFICLWFGDRPFSELLRVFKLRCLQLHISLVTEVKPRTIRFRKHTSDCVFWLQLHVRHRVSNIRDIPFVNKQMCVLRVYNSYPVTWSNFCDVPFSEWPGGLY